MKKPSGKSNKQWDAFHQDRANRRNEKPRKSGILKRLGKLFGVKR